MIPYLKYPERLTRKLLDLINTCSKLAGYKIDIQKSVAFLDSNNKQVEKEIRKRIHNSLTINK
jgi:hypothetical protein